MALQLGPATRDERSFSGRPVSGAITTLFNVVDDLHPDGHTGVDIACAAGTEILAPAEGFVFLRQTDDAIFGNWLILEHEDGWHTLYGHMATAPPVDPLQQVSAGQLIGFVGNTGYSTGPHLHWGLGNAENPYLNKGRPLFDPLDYLFEEADLSPPLSHSNARWNGYAHALARTNGHALFPLPRDERYDYYTLRYPRAD